MSEPDPAIEHWIHHHQDWSDARLRTTVASMVHYCVDHRAAQELLDRREKDRRAEDHREAERRHSELLGRAKICIRYAKWATGVAAIGSAAAIAGLLLQMVSMPSEQKEERLPPLFSPSPSDQPPSSASLPATEPMPKPEAPKPDEEPATSPTLPKQ